MEDGQLVPGSLYIYAPDKGAPVFFAVAFAASMVVHVWQCFRYKSWVLTPLFPFCSLIFAVGFALREYGAFHYDNVVVYIASTYLIYISPPLLELANFHILGRILYYVPQLAPIHPGRVLTTFAFLSAVVEVLGALGVTQSTTPGLPEQKRQAGRSMLKAALVIQIVIALLFACLAAVFHRRCCKSGIRNAKVTTPLLTLYASTALMSIRTVYRITEYWALADTTSVASLSPVVRYEWFFYVFEASIMLADCLLFNVFHPRRYLPERARTCLDEDGVAEIEGPDHLDNRPFWITLVDPFDIAGALQPSWKAPPKKPDAVEVAATPV